MRTSVLKASDGKVPAEGTSLHYVTIGEGSPVVVVHGGPGLGHSYLRPGMDALADGSKVVYYDQRGSGRSELGDPERLTLAAAIEDLDSLREGLGLEKVSLVGHSFGALISVLYGAIHPERVTSMVLANPGPPFDTQQQSELWQEMERRSSVEDRAALSEIQASERFEKRDPETLERFIRTLYLPFFRKRSSADRMDLAFTQTSADHVVGIEEAWMEEFRTLDAIGKVASVTAPTLVVWGALEPIPEAFSLFLAEGIRAGRYMRIEGVNHFTYLEDPDLFFPPVREFLVAEAR